MLFRENGWNGEGGLYRFEKCFHETTDQIKRNIKRASYLIEM